jgi:hypothetical protein
MFAWNVPAALLEGVYGFVTVVSAVSSALDLSLGSIQSLALIHVSRRPFVYAAGLWSACSVACGPGMQSRTVECVNSNGTAVADSNCVLQLAPDATRSCFLKACAVRAFARVVSRLLVLA